MVAGPPRVLERPLRCLDARTAPAREIVRLRLESPRASEPQLVSESCEHRDRPLCDVEQLVGRHVRLREQLEQPALDERVRREPLVAAAAAARPPRSTPGRPSSGRRQPLDDADVRDELDARADRPGGSSATAREIRFTAAVRVAADERPSARSAEPLGASRASAGVASSIGPSSTRYRYACSRW